MAHHQTSPIESSDLTSSGTFTLRPTTPFIPNLAETRKACSSSVTDLEALVDKEIPSTKGRARSSSRSLYSSSTSRHSSNAGSRRNIGIVIGDFTRIYPDELTLSRGERIEIISKHVDISRNIGWWTARNSRGETGLVPVNCVKVVTSSVSSESDLSSVQPTSPSAGDLSPAMPQLLPESSSAAVYPIEIPPDDITLLDIIGVGGFGRVHKAIYKGEEVAVKVARQANFDTVKVISEVLSEAEKFAKLAHENVCALVGVSLLKDIYLVMEYAKGGSLSSIIHERGLVIPIDVVLDWGVQIADGMQYLHHEVHPSMIHRDLKSSNILLQYVITGTNFHNNVIKITDFGLAREIEHTTRMSTAGTYPWMAPEVIKSSEFSTKSDVWSFGVVLWELLTGEKPYTGLNLYLVAYGVGSGSLNLPIHEDCPQPLAILLKECWQRSYMDRPTFKTIYTTLTNLSFNVSIARMDYEQFKSLQLAWKLQIQKAFQEHKKNDTGFEDKQKDLLSKMRKQDQKVIQLEKEKLQLVNMIEKFHIELQKLSENEQRPPRVKPFSFKRMIEKMMVNKEVNKPKGSSKAEALAKEIQRKMKDIDVTEDLLAKYSQNVPHKKSSLHIPTGGGATVMPGESKTTGLMVQHTRQPSDSGIRTGLHPSPTLVPQRTGSLNSKQRKLSPSTAVRSRNGDVPMNKPDAFESSPRRHNSCDSIVPVPVQFDSGKHSFTSSLSCEVDNLIDFNQVTTVNLSDGDALLADLDPLKQPPSKHVPLPPVSCSVPVSHDSLFSESNSPMGLGIRGFSPTPVPSYTRVSPRDSLTESSFRPRPHSSQDSSTSAPVSRPGTPKLRPQSYSISPSGSVHSLPQYPTSSGDPISYFGSDSSASIDFDDTLFMENVLLQPLNKK